MFLKALSTPTLVEISRPRGLLWLWTWGSVRVGLRGVQPPHPAIDDAHVWSAAADTRCPWTLGVQENGLGGGLCALQQLLGDQAAEARTRVSVLNDGFQREHLLDGPFVI